MKIKFLGLILFSFALISCATMPVSQPIWKTSPEINIGYDKGWRTFVNTLENFELETLDAQSGYIKSAWKTTDTCWAGIAYGGSIPCKRERLIARVKSQKPFIVSVNVEVEAKDMTANWFYVEKWTSKGSNIQMENAIMQRFLTEVK